MAKKKVSKRYFNREKFTCFVRYMIFVAKGKRCVAYIELMNIFGLSEAQVAYYAGELGNFCSWNGFPPLNGLIISKTECVPSKGFKWYQKKYGKSWGEIVTDCWDKFRVTAPIKKQRQDFSGMDNVVEDFLSEQDV